MKQRLLEYAVDNHMLLDEAPVDHDFDQDEMEADEEVEIDVDAVTRFEDIVDSIDNLLREAYDIVKDAVEAGALASIEAERARLYWHHQIGSAISSDGRSSGFTMSDTLEALRDAEIGGEGT